MCFLYRPTRKLTAVGFLVALLAVPIPGAAKDQSQFSHSEFDAILKEAADLAHYKKKVEMTARAGGGHLKIVDGIERLDDARWRVTVTVYDYEKGSTTAIYIKKYPVVIQNLGSGFEALFLSPEVPAHLFDRALENEYAKKAREEYVKKHKDVQVTYGREGDQVSIRSRYSYAGGVSSKDVRDRLEELLVACSWVGRMAFVSTRLEEAGLQRDLRKGKPSHLSKAELLLVLGWNLSNVEEESDETDEGYWAFEVKGRRLRILNYGDRVVFAYTRKLPEGMSAEARAQVLATMERWVSKNRAKHATSTEATWHAVDDNYLWIAATFMLGGKVKGEEIEKGYEHFRNNFSVKVDEEVRKAIDRALN